MLLSFIGVAQLSMCDSSMVHAGPDGHEFVAGSVPREGRTPVRINIILDSHTVSVTPVPDFKITNKCNARDETTVARSSSARDRVPGARSTRTGAEAEPSRPTNERVRVAGPRATGPRPHDSKTLGSQWRAAAKRKRTMYNGVVERARESQGTQRGSREGSRH